jgi:REP element-mobilizing transposase RayT
MNRGRRGEAVFIDNRDYDAFMKLLQESTELWRIRIAAYCLMSNHYHLLVQTPCANLSRAMRHIDGIYTQRYNRRHKTVGQVFAGRYKSIIIDADTYLLDVVRYIHKNPVRAGMVDQIQRYPWTSHPGYLADKPEWGWLHKGFVLSTFSSDRNEAKKGDTNDSSPTTILRRSRDFSRERTFMLFWEPIDSSGGYVSAL